MQSDERCCGLEKVGRWEVGSGGCGRTVGRGGRRVICWYAGQWEEVVTGSIRVVLVLVTLVACDVLLDLQVLGEVLGEGLDSSDQDDLDSSGLDDLGSSGLDDLDFLGQADLDGLSGRSDAAP